MIGRRFLGYFIVAVVIAVAATVVFEVVTLSRAADHAVAQNMLFARSVARYVEGVVAREAAVIDRFLTDLPSGDVDKDEVATRLRGLRAAVLDEGGVAVFDDHGTALATSLDAGGLPPPNTLLPALRHARTTERHQVTDVWRGVDGRARATVVVGRVHDGQWLGATAHLVLDGDDFQRSFRFFVVNDQSRLQVLDSTGVALFSTRPQERFQSVVHGTYFADRVRLGRPVTMPCHSCHESGAQEPVRESEITTVVPVPGTGWAVTVREGTRALYAPMREMAVTSVSFAAIILGLFVGFYIVLSRRVLRPMGQLVAAASKVAGSGTGAIPGASSPEDFGGLAQSLDALRERGVPLGGERGDGRGPLDAMPTLTSPDDALEALGETLDAVLDGLGRVRPVRAALLWVAGEPLGEGICRARGVTLPGGGCSGLLGRIPEDRTSVTPSDLEVMGIRLAGADDVRVFFIQRFRVLDSLNGQIWIGVDAASTDMGPYLAPAVQLIAAHVQSLVERNVLYDQLLQEHGRKTKMLQHLFEAEDEERQRIAREIHDETAQDLSALLLLLEGFPAGGDAQAQTAKLERAKDLVVQTLEHTDRLMRRLRPAVLDDLGLVEAVRATGRNVLEASGIEFELSVEGPWAPLTRSLEVAIYRVFQEAMTNVIRHASADRVRAGLHLGPRGLDAWFEDDGQGMDLGWLTDRRARPRWGLLGMRERILQLGGAIRFSSPAGGGLRIELEVPLSPDDQAEPPAEERRPA